MAKIHRKQTTKAGTDGKRIKIESRKWYGTIRLPDGRYRQIPLSEDYRASLGLLRRAQSEQDNLRALGLTDASKARTRPLTVHVEGFREHLISKGSSPRHIRQVIGEVERVTRAMKATRIQDLNSGKIATILECWRREGLPASMETRRGRTPAPLSREASNHYVRSLRAFSRWLWSSEVVESDILRGLRPLNVKVDRRHVRRALSDTEISRLLRMTHSHGKPIVGKGWSLTGADRAVLYRLAAFSGLRASELASLCPASINIDAGTIRVEAASSKHRKDDVLPLHPELAGILKPWLESKDPSAPLFPGRWNRMASKIIQKDLQRAGIPYVDSQGRFYDFHALRHQFATMVCRSGIPVGTAMKLLRHSSPELTLRVYNDVAPDELRDALSRLPGLTD